MQPTRRKRYFSDPFRSERCPVLIALIAHVALGLLFALAARRQFREGRVPWGREARVVATFEVIVGFPVALYLYWVHPDWTLMYAIDPGRQPAFTFLIGLVLLAGALAAGYGGGWALLQRWRPRAVAAALLAAALALLVALVTWRARVFHYGTFAGFRRGDTMPLASTKLFFVLWVLAAGTGAAALVTARALRWEARRNGRLEGTSATRRRAS